MTTILAHSPVTGPRPERPFKLWFTFTGTFAQNAIDAIDLPASQFAAVPIIYERFIPIPRLWHNRKAGCWEPEQYGSSIFNPTTGWSLDALRKWALDFAQKHHQKGGGPVVFDIEDVHPFFSTMHDAAANLEQMRADLAVHHGVTDVLYQNDMIRFGLRQMWSTLMDALAEAGVDASFYGHTPARVAASPESHRDGRCWFDQRQRRTHPVIYEWIGSRSMVDHANQVIRPRIRAAKRLSPLAPCMPFITDLLDDGSGDAGNRITAEKLDSMIQVSRDEGADGVVLWRHVNTTQHLTHWIASVNEIVRPALERHFAQPAEQKSPA